MKDFTFRWCDPVSAKSAEFTASTEEEFCEAAINAAIDYRLTSVKKLGISCHYPFAHLEIRHGGSDKKWQGLRFAWNCPPMHLTALGSHIDDIDGHKPSDVERIRSLSHAWWNSIKRWTSSYLHHQATAAQDTLHPTKVAQG